MFIFLTLASAMIYKSNKPSRNDATGRQMRDKIGSSTCLPIPTVERLLGQDHRLGRIGRPNSSRGPTEEKQSENLKSEMVQIMLGTIDKRAEETLRAHLLVILKPELETLEGDFKLLFQKVLQDRERFLYVHLNGDDGVETATRNETSIDSNSYTGTMYL